MEHEPAPEENLDQNEATPTPQQESLAEDQEVLDTLDKEVTQEMNRNQE